ncbi:transposase [Anoxynatronum buryatiense]|uniref:Transposase n=1 Tax=Anoxynatronum buryatiense TaxID=489973 RepID=A0AA45WZG9_9CLOT|nr:Transposase [Anoxynatronum buryatiense]
MGPHPTQAERDEILKLHFEKGYSTRLLARKTGFSRSEILNWIRDYHKNSQVTDITAKKSQLKKASEAKRILPKTRIRLR